MAKIKQEIRVVIRQITASVTFLPLHLRRPHLHARQYRGATGVERERRQAHHKLGRGQAEVILHWSAQVSSNLDDLFNYVGRLIHFNSLLVTEVPLAALI